MTETRLDGVAALILRVGLGGLFLAHLGLKVFVFTPAGFAGFFAKLGLPAPLAYLTMLVELVVGIGLLAGVATRFVALLGIPVLLGAIVMVHGANGFWFMAPGGGWEFPGLWIVALVAQSLLGDGVLALGPQLLPALSAPRPQAA
jgi:putative oxidoreductase